MKMKPLILILTWGIGFPASAATLGDWSRECKGYEIAVLNRLLGCEEVLVGSHAVQTSPRLADFVRRTLKTPNLYCETGEFVSANTESVTAWYIIHSKDATFRLEVVENRLEGTAKIVVRNYHYLPRRLQPCKKK